MNLKLKYFSFHSSTKLDAIKHYITIISTQFSNRLDALMRICARPGQGDDAMGGAPMEHRGRHFCYRVSGRGVGHVSGNHL